MAAMPSAIEVRDVSKRFRLYHEQFTSLKERMLHGGRVPFEDFFALQHVTFEVEEGKTFGLLGHNGSGKSTLLKCIAGIIQPTAGQVVTRGRVAALLELGAGFQPEMSGRENIYLNASLLGMSKKYVDAHFDQIIEFAELEPFIDNQVKYYSSGMYVRLGFAVAVHMDPDILIVDEVLAVGDELFQRKCLERVKQFQREGRTIVVVTHAADQVRQVCDRAAVLDHGHLVGIGTPGQAVRSFREHLLRRQAYTEGDQLAELISLADDGATVAADVTPPPVTPGRQPASDLAPTVDPSPFHSKHADGLTIVYVRFEHSHDDERSYLLPGEPLRIVVGYHADREYVDVLPGYTVYDQEGRFLFGANNKIFPAEIVVQPGDGEFVFEMDSIPLLDGDYPVTIGILTHDEYTVYDWHEQQYSFSVMNPEISCGLMAVPTSISRRDRPSEPATESVAASESVSG
jgi:ABC-type polysaccharide/polyol phosphate transport system ATPase subunit